jgi:hypothetical protein
MATNVVGGVEKIELAPAFFTEAAATSAVWTQLEYIAGDTVAYTKNSDTPTDLIPEDKDTAFITFYAPGDADQITIGVLQQLPSVMQMLENVVYTPATTRIVNLAKRKVANLAIRLTTRSMKDGRKQIIILPNVQVVTTYVGNFTKTAVQQLLLTGKVGSFKTTTDNLDAISIKTWVTEAGAAIDSTNP